MVNTHVDILYCLGLVRQWNRSLYQNHEKLIIVTTKFEVSVIKKTQSWIFSALYLLELAKNFDFPDKVRDQKPLLIVQYGEI